MTGVIYNENEPFAAEWLKNLSEAGHIARGEVDDRSIVALEPADVREFTQAHFFAGIGVWSHALRLAGWPDDEPVWTGSCPCQPFSQAGQKKGFADERHLWPAWFRLIKKCRPPVIFGEQIASTDGLKWLDAVYADLEGAGYAVGAADLCAAGVGAPHIRQRLYFVAYTREGGRALGGAARIHGRRQAARGEETAARGGDRQRGDDAARRGAPRGLADTDGRDAFDGEVQRRGEHGLRASGRRDHGGARVSERTEDAGATRRLGDASRQGGGRDAGAVPRTQEKGAREGLDARRESHVAPAPGAARKLGDASNPGLEGYRPNTLQERRKGAQRPATPSSTAGFWHPADWLPCLDGKARPTEPGTFPLAYGAPARVGRLRAYGNAIVAEAAATFIQAVIEGAARE